MLACVVLPCLIAAVRPAAANDIYPQRPVKFIVNYPAGGTTDATARLLADQLSRKWGQATVVENRPGAGGNIGAEAVFNAEPDGYTVLFTPASPVTINRWLYARLPFEPDAFVPATLAGVSPTVLIVRPGLEARTVSELIALAQRQPGKLTVAIQGNGSTSHLTSELFQTTAGVTFTTVPFRGSAPALQTMISGDIDIMFDNLSSSLPLVRGGHARLLAVGNGTRVPSLPDTPTLAETLPGFVSDTWTGLFLPPKTPRAIAEQLSRDVIEVQKSPALVERFHAMQLEPLGTSPEATAVAVRDHAQQWKKVIDAAKIRADESASR